MSGIYFGTVFQIDTPSGVPPLTNFRLSDGTKPENVFFSGIPCVVVFITNRNGTIGLYQTSTNTRIFSNDTTATTVGIQMYTNYIANVTPKYYFSTLKDGNVFSPSQPGSINPPSYLYQQLL